MKSEYINGIKIFVPESRQDLIQYALNKKKILVAVNAEKILNITSKTKNIINNNLGYADGIGAVWALHKKGLKEAVKIPGCELWLDIVSNFYKHKTFYLVGGKQKVIEETVKKLEKNFKGIKILNFRDGYLKTNKEKNDLKKDIKKLKPDIVFIAMGSPKQELLIEEIHKVHKATYQGLGGSFDVYIGRIKRAPQWLIQYNFEWAYRLIKQPSRIKRQIYLMRFLILLQFNVKL